jgi:hypothetical protein
LYHQGLVADISNRDRLVQANADSPSYIPVTVSEKQKTLKLIE